MSEVVHSLVTENLKGRQFWKEVTVGFLVEQDFCLINRTRADFNVLLTVRLSIMLVINHLMHKILFYNKFTIYLYMFRALCTHHQEVKTVLYSIWYHHTL